MAHNRTIAIPDAFEVTDLYYDAATGLVKSATVEPKKVLYCAITLDKDTGFAKLITESDFKKTKNLHTKPHSPSATTVQNRPRVGIDSSALSKSSSRWSLKPCSVTDQDLRRAVKNSSVSQNPKKKLALNKKGLKLTEP